MFNWFFDLLASRSNAKTKARVDYYGRRAKLIQAHNGLRRAKHSIPTFTQRTPRKATVTQLKVAA